MDASPRRDLGAQSNVPAIEAALGYHFQQPALLDRALTHKSFFNERTAATDTHNERLEFLGDAVVSLVVTDCLVTRFPEWNEGQLSKVKAQLVSESCLADAARRLGLGQFLRLGRGEELTAGREKPSLLADGLEAVTAAIYADGGFEASRDFVLRVLAREVHALSAQTGVLESSDYKTRFQEQCQRRFDLLPTYRTTGERGPDHRKEFEVEVVIRGEIWGAGRGHTKKTAEQAAARAALARLESEPPHGA
ncbi:MAG: ribonuclease III [Nitrospiraceae bacterium]